MQQIGATSKAGGWSQIDRRHFIAVTVLAVVIGIIATIQGTADIHAFDPAHSTGGAFDSDQLLFFFPAAQHILDGHPFAIYAVRAAGSYPNYNPPLGTLLIAPLLAIGQAFLPGASACVSAGDNDVACRSLLGFVGLGFIPFVIAMGVVTLGAVRRLYPTLSQGQALIAYSLIVLTPLTWQNFTQWWHFEQPMMLFFFVLGVSQLQAKRPYLAGLFLGLAILSRTTAAVPLIALLVVLLAERSWNTMLKLGGTIAAVAVLGFGPFFLFDRANAIYSLISWRGTAPIGNSIWSLVSSSALPQCSAKLDCLARRLDLPTAALLAAIVAYLAVRRFGVSAMQRNLYAVLAIAALLVPMLSKTNWPYYYAEPFVFIVIWEFSTLHETPVGLWRWPVISIAYLCAVSTLGQFMWEPSTTHGGIVLRLMGLIQFGTLLVFAYAIWQRFSELRVGGQDEPPIAQPPPMMREMRR